LPRTYDVVDAVLTAIVALVEVVVGDPLAAVGIVLGLDLPGRLTGRCSAVFVAVLEVGVEVVADDFDGLAWWQTGTLKKPKSFFSGLGMFLCVNSGRSDPQTEEVRAVDDRHCLSW
jgi:hypothetical protein